jgi:hypothetical protein
VLGSDVEFHFGLIDILFSLCRFVGRFALLKANFINFLDKRVSKAGPQSKDKVDYALFEGLSSWIDMIESANFNNQFEGTLSDLGVFVETPLTRKFCKLFIITSHNKTHWFLVKFISTLNLYCLFNK